MELGGIGLVATEDPDTRGYYVLKWTSLPYTLQADKPTEFGTFAEGTLVADGEYLNPVGRARDWYTGSPGNVTTVQVAHVLLPGITLLPISASDKLPNACNKAAATRDGARKLSPSDHEAAMAEGVRRDRLEYDSQSDSESEESEEESEEESDAPEDASDEE